ncbi:MAG: DapH/DapD/GlmU-related protein [Bacteroidota bacterium]
MRSFFWALEDLGWNIKCRYNFWLHGPYGLAKVIENMPFRFLTKYLRRYGASIGNNCHIEKGVILHRPDSKIPFKNLILEDHAFIGHKSLIDLSEKVIFEKYSGVSGFCQVWTHQTSSLVPPCPEERGEVRLCEQAMVYSGTIVTPGITIGKQSKVGANSLVIKSIGDFAFWGGVPAKSLK